MGEFTKDVISEEDEISILDLSREPNKDSILR